MSNSIILKYVTLIEKNQIIFLEKETTKQFSYYEVTKKIKKWVI